MGTQPQQETDWWDALPQCVHAVGFPKWKRPHVRPFLVPPSGKLRFHDRLESALFAAQQDGWPVVVWASKLPDPLPACPVPLWRMEDGFLRSRGLGSDLLAANSLVVDDQGIYYDPSEPSRLETLLETYPFDEALLARAAILRARIVEANLTKYNVGGAKLPEFPEGREVHLVVGQVEEDASIRKGGGAVQTNAGLLKAVRERHPDAWILYKPHPDVVAGNRARGDADRSPLAYADQEVRDCALPLLLPHVARLHTITSLSGFEMLLRGGAVTTYGTPFYAGWGLTEHYGAPCVRRTRSLSLDALVAATLILYPRYYDWKAGHAISAEACVECLKTMKDPTPYAHLYVRQVLRFGRWIKGRIDRDNAC